MMKKKLVKQLKMMRRISAVRRNLKRSKLVKRLKKPSVRNVLKKKPTKRKWKNRMRLKDFARLN